MFSKQNSQHKGILRLFIVFPFSIMLLCSFVLFDDEAVGAFGCEIKTPDEAIAELKYGNNRFLDNLPINYKYDAQIETTKNGQHPHSFILGCIDSRVPPEIIFNQELAICLYDALPETLKMTIFWEVWNLPLK